MSNEELVVLIQAGERDKLLGLWEQVEKFVDMKAGKQAQALKGFGGVTSEDLYQSGYIALVAAVDSYDPAADCPFIPWLAFHLKTAFAEAAGYRTSKQDMLNKTRSLDAPIQEGGIDSDTAGTILSDPSATHDFQDAENRIWVEQLRVVLDKALAELPADQAELLHRRYYMGQTKKQTAAAIGVSREAVRRRENKALSALRQQLAEDWAPWTN